MKKEIILFDFDGVIVDTFEMSYQIAKKMMPQIYRTHDDYRASFEGNIYEQVKGLTDDFNKHHDHWFERYSPKLIVQPLITGMKKVLVELSKKYILIIISSSITSPIKEYCKKHDVYDLFDEIFGADVHLSKVDKINMVFKKYDAKAKDCVFITDTLGDMKEAAKSGVKAIAVTWGFHDLVRLKKGKPETIVKKPNLLVKEIDKYFNL